MKIVTMIRCLMPKVEKVSNPPRPLTDMTDGELVAEMKKGNEQAFRTLVKRHYVFACRWAHQLTGDETSAKELMSLAFEQSYRFRHNIPEYQTYRTAKFNVFIRDKIDLLWLDQKRRPVIKSLK